MKKKNSAVGIGVMIAGLIFLGINLYLLKNHTYYFPKLMLTGIVSISFGLGLALFPGAPVEIKNNRNLLKDKWQNSKGRDKLMWILFLLIGVAASIWTLIYFDLNIS